jgi:Mn-dependent DtxR family transcriptional regulator
MSQAYISLLNSFSISKCSLVAQLTLRHIVEISNQRGVSFIKQKTIATRIGVDIRTISSAIRELKKGGWITSRRTGRYNVYQVQLPPVLTTEGG